ncbi:MAG: hypothetical protein MI747_01295 [Desulfobacterales bacterium]|nr:hypothetical protein [Desulfobacterales bacterium]
MRCSWGIPATLGLVILSMVAASPALARPWTLLPAKYTILRYQRDADLAAFNRAIDFGGQSQGFLFFQGAEETGEGLDREVRQKLNRMVEKVQLILDMRKPFPRVFINLYSNAEDLHWAYFQIYGTRKELRAWYTFQHNTIYINVLDLHSGMLAHELAHAVVDHYLGVRPPRATAEILARYVDQHLESEAKIY